MTLDKTNINNFVQIPTIDDNLMSSKIVVLLCKKLGI